MPKVSIFPMAFSSLTVPKLREACEAAGLDSKGLKAVLVARLEENESLNESTGVKEEEDAKEAQVDSPSRVAGGRKR